MEYFYSGAIRKYFYWETLIFLNKEKISYLLQLFNTFVLLINHLTVAGIIKLLLGRSKNNGEFSEAE